MGTPVAVKVLKLVERFFFVAPSRGIRPSGTILRNPLDEVVPMGVWPAVKT